MPEPLYANGSSNGRPNGLAGDHHIYPGDHGPTGITQLRETLGLLWNGKWIVLAAVVLVLGAVAIYTYTLPEQYRTANLLLVEPQQDPMGQQLNLQIQGTGRSDEALSKELLVIRESVELARRVARRLLEMQTAPATGEPLQILHTATGEQLAEDQVANRVMGHVEAYSTGNSQSAVRISASSTQPGEAAAIANVYADQYIARTREKSQADIRGSRKFLQTQADKLQGRLDSLENRISNYMSQKGAAALDQESSRLVQQISQLEAQRDEARITLEMKRASLETKEEELKKIEPKLVERAASGVESELKRVQQMKARKEGNLEQIYQENPGLQENPDPAVQDLKDEISRLGERSDTLAREYINEAMSVGGINPTPTGEGSGGQGLSYVARQREQLAQMRIEVSGLEAKLRTLNQRLDEYRQRLKNIPAQSIQLAQMQRARQSAEKLYTFIIEKLQETRIAEESKIAYAEVLRPAGVPSVPFAPQKRRNLIMGMMLGLLLGGGLVLLRERLDTHLRHPEDLQAQGHNVIGVIPDMQPAIESDFEGASYVTVDGRELSTSLAMLLSPMSAPAEAYRRLRTNIQFSHPDTVVQTLLVTSPKIGEGKSTTATNLAAAMAQASRRTVIVDADLRRPQVHKMLDRTREPGLSDLLFERHAFDPAVFATGVDDLYAIPAGSGVPNPAELLGSKKMRQFIEQLRTSFDVVIFDSPPAVPFSDAMLLSTQCDGTVVVGAADATDERTFNHAIETFEDVGATVLGSVLNRFDARSSPYGYSYHYAYQYDIDAYYAADEPSSV